MFNQGNQSLQNVIDPHIEPLLTRVLQTQKFGSCRRPIKIHELKFKDGMKSDCLDLAVPYADQTLKWTVLFDSEFPELGPDFIFNDENFLADPDIDTLKKWVPNLINWQYWNNDALLDVLKDLLAYYKRHQIDLLRMHCTESLIFDYESLIELIGEDNVEIIILNPSMKSAEVKFFIKLSTDFSRLPQRSKYHQMDSAMLVVTFSGPKFNNVVPSLFLSKAVEEILGSMETLKIPPYPMSNALLIDYVPDIMKFLADKVDAVVASSTKKRDFLSTLLLTLRGSIIEYDAIDLSQASFLVEKKDFHFFIHFRIPSGFPREKPEIVLQSAYHMDHSGKMLTQPVTKFSYNQQMEPSQMIQSILSHIEEKEVEPFQQFCTKKNRF